MLVLVTMLYPLAAFPPSYIVNHENDTIFGTGNISDDFEYCLFKRINGSELITYYPNEISAFRIIDGSYYVSREIKNADGVAKWFFLEYLVDGEIDLFYLAKPSKYYIKKENADFLELNDKVFNEEWRDGKNFNVQDKKYLGYLRVYLSETPELYPQIDRMNRLNQNNLVSLAIDYHNAVCDDYECTNYTKRISPVTFKFEMVSGVNHHNEYYSPHVGFLMHLWRPLKNEKLFIKLGILYADKIKWAKYSYYNDDFKKGKDYRIKFPLSFQYVFGEKDFKPTLAIGWPTGLLISSVQGGFLYSLNKNWEISLNGSVDGLIMMITDPNTDIFYHSINFGLVYTPKNNLF